jgi:hypothetical protein
MGHHAWLTNWDWPSLPFCLGWPQTMTLLISTSRVARITHMSQPHLATNIDLVYINKSARRRALEVVCNLYWGVCYADLHCFLYFCWFCATTFPWEPLLSWQYWLPVGRWDAPGLGGYFLFLSTDLEKWSLYSSKGFSECNGTKYA